MFYLSDFRKFTAVLALLFLAPLISFSQDYELNGDAEFLDDDCIQLTSNQNSQNGNFWALEQINLNEAFNMQFILYLGTSDGGADGMCFVLQNNDTDISGILGGGIGYGTIGNSVGIEFDTWQNADNSDPFADHIGIVSNGSNSHTLSSALTPAVQASSTSTNIEDGQDHFVEIDWQPESNELSVYFDCVLRTTSTTDLVEEIFGGDSLVYWGFTASTGGANNIHQVCMYTPANLEEQEIAICDGGTAVLDVGGNPDGDFLWTPADGLSSTTAATPSASPTETTTYSVDYSDYCDNLVSTTYTVYVEDLDLAIEGSLQIDCINEQAPLEAVSNPLFDLDYLWSTDGGVMIGDYFSPNVTALTDGFYTISVSQDDACSDEVTVEVIADNETYEVSVEPAPDITCYDGQISLTGSSSGSDGEYLWSTDSGTIESGANTLNPTVSATGNYTLSVTNPSNGCISEATVVVNGNTNPPEVFAGTADTVNCDQPVVVIEGVSTDAFTLQAQWTTSNGNIVSGANSLNPTVNSAGDYTLTILNLDNGCENSDQITVFQSSDGVPDLSNLILPNIFTPNDDEWNEEYLPFLSGQPELEVWTLFDSFNLSVRNRWGNEVYNWNGNNDPWDGKDLSEGTYYVILEYEINCGEIISGSKTGYVELVR